VIHRSLIRKGSGTHSILTEGACEASREHNINASHSPKTCRADETVEALYATG
jgi:hypothetical protein